MNKLIPAFTFAATLAVSDVAANEISKSRETADLAMLRWRVVNTPDFARNTRNRELLAHGEATVVYDKNSSPTGLVVKPVAVPNVPAPTIRFFIPENDPASLTRTLEQSSPGGPPFPNQFINTPSSLACIYKLVSPPLPGCNPDKTRMNPVGGSGAIAVVVVYHHPDVQSSLNMFSTQFGLPPASVQTVYASTKPPLDISGSGWNEEANLDIQWAHAMAPNAKLILVESKPDEFISDAVAKARNLVAQNGGGVVSMSFSGLQPGFDRFFSNKKGVIMVASAGDTPGYEMPSGYPSVVSVGGTTINRDFITHNYTSETVWDDTGGDVALFESWGRPSYQNGVKAIVGPYRGTPDLSFVANPTSGAWVVSNGSWIIVGGTSLGAPAVSGIINVAQSPGHLDSTLSLLTKVYNRALAESSTAPFRDIISGSCGANQPGKILKARTGYDLCTGLGSPLKYNAFK